MRGQNASEPGLYHGMLVSPAGPRKACEVASRSAYRRPRSNRTLASAPTSLGPENAIIGRILLENGYRTSWFGKDHNTPDFAASQADPFDQWPTAIVWASSTSTA